MDVRKRLDREQEPVLRARRGRVLPRLARRPRRSAASPRTSTATSTSSRTTTGACSASSSARTTPRRRARCSTPPRRGCASAGATAWSGRWTSRPTTSAACWSRATSARRSSSRPGTTPTTRRCSRAPAWPRRWTCYMWSLHVDEPRAASTRRSGRWPRRSSPSTGSSCRADAQARPRRPRSTRFLEVYNAAWERNWGFVPLTEEEVRHYAKDLKPVLDENWAMIAEARTRRGRRRRADAARLQPGARATQRPPAAVRLGQGPVLRAREDRPRARVRARRQARVPAHRRGRALLPDALRRRPSARRRRAARWAGSSRPTRR